MSERDERGEPITLTKEQWQAMHDASTIAEGEARYRTMLRRFKALERLTKDTPRSQR